MGSTNDDQNGDNALTKTTTDTTPALSAPPVKHILISGGVIRSHFALDGSRANAVQLLRVLAAV